MNRIQELRSLLRQHKVDAFIVTHLPHIRYLTGFSGSNATLIVMPRSLFFFTDGRYTEQIKTELFPLTRLKTFIERDVWQYVSEKDLLSSIERIGFEADHTSFAAAERIKAKLKPLKLVPLTNLLEDVTVPKTADEVANIQKAADIAAQVYEYILNFVKPGMRENEVAAEISYQGKKLGSEGDAFDIIVASGPRGALPHGHASTKKLKKGELVTLDFGCIVNGFNSDMTRTFALGKPKPLHKKVFDIVLEAEQAAVAAVRAGINAKELDAVARKIIEDAGYGENFTHSLGHGLGIKVHENPGISFRSDKVTIPEGSVITIEPGIYIPDTCGVRIEDDVHVTATGCTVLTTAPRELIIV